MKVKDEVTDRAATSSLVLPAPSLPPLVAADRVRVRFGSVLAVRDVTLNVGRGELLGLIGPNGAGKTTLLRAIAGLQPMESGRVHVMGRELVPGAVDVLGDVGFTPDTPPLYDALNVRDFLSFIAKGYGLGAAEARERIDFWLEKVWLSEKAGQKIKALSRGMRQRVGIARTLLPNPFVVLLDEPAAGLDPAGRVQFRQLLCDLREQGKALIVSSHILSDMEEYCTHVGIMSRGAMVRFGTVAQIAHAGGPGGGEGEGDGEGGGTAAASRCQYALVLARSLPDALQRLAGVAGVDGVHQEGERITFRYDRDRERAAALLAELLRIGLPVASFAPDGADLERAYLRFGIGEVD